MFCADGSVASLQSLSCVEQGLELFCPDGSVASLHSLSSVEYCLELFCADVTVGSQQSTSCVEQGLVLFCSDGSVAILHSHIAVQNSAQYCSVQMDLWLACRALQAIAVQNRAQYCSVQRDLWLAYRALQLCRIGLSIVLCRWNCGQPAEPVLPGYRGAGEEEHGQGEGPRLQEPHLTHPGPAGVHQTTFYELSRRKNIFCSCFLPVNRGRETNKKYISDTTYSSMSLQIDRFRYKVLHFLVFNATMNGLPLNPNNHH